MPRPRLHLLALVALTLLSLTALPAQEVNVTQNLNTASLPAAPVPLEGAYAAVLGGRYVIVSPIDGQAHAFDAETQSWGSLGSLPQIPSEAGFTSDGSSLYLVGGRDANGSLRTSVTKLELQGNAIVATNLPELPAPIAQPATLVAGGKLYAAGGIGEGAASKGDVAFRALDLGAANASWQALPSMLGAGRSGGQLLSAIESLYCIGGYGTDGQPAPVAAYHPIYGWSERSAPPVWSPGASIAPVGDAHALVLIGNDAHLYHAIGDTWVQLASYPELQGAYARLVGSGNALAALSPAQSLKISFADPVTNYGWWDHSAVACYFAIMLYVGFYFTKQSKTTQNYFRGGNRIPWWATGMSLFATGASALSLLSMPGKSYSTNWTFFTISIYSVICLPLSMYLLAPLVRKLNFATAFEYLEHRFGLSVRMFGSAIFVLQQILGRMGPVMLLPAIAMHAITGIDVRTSIIAMGVVTTLYTFLGGLAAVIWTDTIQGFVMVLAVFGCLLLVYLKIDMPIGEMWTTLGADAKLHMFDWGVSLNESNVLTIFFGILAITLFGISDQNYVQRVQCTPSLGDAKKAIATQMAVAVPINLLLFGLGTALYLFYREHPSDLNPVMKNDGIFPFFAAQQLPPGVSGLVVAALLAATMSTISSAICSVSNLGVDDFYRRFRKGTTDTEAVIMGRILTAVVGILGIAAALFLSEFKAPSIWDLALKVISFITSATLGIFALGLFSRKANEIGVIVGIIAGMGSTYYLQTETGFSYWLYPISGSLVTYLVGIAVSLATGGNRKPIDGLTVFTLRNRRGGLDD